jgi:hypothetical protein
MRLVVSGRFRVDGRRSSQNWEPRAILVCKAVRVLRVDFDICNGHQARVPAPKMLNAPQITRLRVTHFWVLGDCTQHWRPADSLSVKLDQQA